MNPTMTPTPTTLKPKSPGQKLMEKTFDDFLATKVTARLVKWDEIGPTAQQAWESLASSINTGVIKPATQISSH